MTVFVFEHGEQVELGGSRRSGRRHHRAIRACGERAVVQPGIPAGAVGGGIDGDGVVGEGSDVAVGEQADIEVHVGHQRRRIRHQAAGDPVRPRLRRRLCHFIQRQCAGGGAGGDGADDAYLLVGGGRVRGGCDIIVGVRGQAQADVFQNEQGADGIERIGGTGERGAAVIGADNAAVAVDLGERDQHHLALHVGRNLHALGEILEERAGDRDELVNHASPGRQIGQWRGVWIERSVEGVERAAVVEGDRHFKRGGRRQRQRHVDVEVEVVVRRRHEQPVVRQC